jgi:gamma-glutamyl-gamma-aminobutyrate hydrolase PuuD
MAAVPLPLDTEAAMVTMKATSCAALLLTGGDDLCEVGGQTPERDRLEENLVRTAACAKTPVMGVCRGMQLIVRAFGGELQEVDGHVATTHHLLGPLGGREVNSFHRWAVSRVPASLELTATTRDGSIEAIRHRTLPITAIMWHPERGEPFEAEDVRLFIAALGGPT